MAHQLGTATLRRDLLGETDLRQQAQMFLRLFREAVQQGEFSEIMTPEWEKMRVFLDALSHSRDEHGFTPSEIAMFVFSLRQPLVEHLRRFYGRDTAGLDEDLRNASMLLDKLGLYTTEIYQQGREAIIHRQHQELLELSTPVVTLWEGILALPLIGTLDSARTQIVMENMLQRIAETGSPIAIIDITGVPTVDTMVAQHLLKTVAAARLMGADCIISGIRPQIAQTMVHLGVVLGDVTTKATLADAFTVALQRTGRVIVTRPTPMLRESPFETSAKREDLWNTSPS
jgi:rsbT co-antagonist protein RsbR